MRRRYTAPSWPLMRSTGRGLWPTAAICLSWSTALPRSPGTGCGKYAGSGSWRRIWTRSCGLCGSWTQRPGGRWRRTSRTICLTTTSSIRTGPLRWSCGPRRHRRRSGPFWRPSSLNRIRRSVELNAPGPPCTAIYCIGRPFPRPLPGPADPGRCPR